LEVQVLFVGWIIFHVIVCLALIAVVLMQSAKGEGLAGTSFGGGMSNAVFGGRGAASFLSKATTILAVVFFVNCGVLAFMSANRSGVSMGSAGTATESTESPITRQAQAERERALEQQQAAQQRQGGDTVNAGSIQMPPPSQPQQGTDQGTDQSGGGN
jgi:preprotein translocase subunit SecG